MILPLIDLRSKSDYQTGHFKGATHLPWSELPFRLNELPCRPAKLNVLGVLSECEAASTFLIQKGYEICHQYTAEQLDLYPSKVVKGVSSVRLWQPTPLIVEYLDLLRRENYHLPKQGIDLGCGGGRDSVYLSMQGVAMMGVEHQKSVIVRAKSLAKHSGVQVDWQTKEVADILAQPKVSADLMVGIRFLDRDLLNVMGQKLVPGGWLVYQTFVEGCEQFKGPKNPKFILKKGELSQIFANFEIFIDRIDTLKDGRPVSSFIAQKKEHA